jgi:hypothetical protein
MAVRLSALRTGRALLLRNIIFLLLILILEKFVEQGVVFCGWIALDGSVVFVGGYFL